MKTEKFNKELVKKIEDLSEKITLKMIQVGTDKTNFKMLGMLPSDIGTMMKELNLTKVPVNSRMNQLEKVGLAKRWRGTGRIVLTDLGKCFMDTIKDGEKIIIKQIEDYNMLGRLI